MRMLRLFLPLSLGFCLLGLPPSASPLVTSARADDSKDDSTATLQETKDWILQNMRKSYFYDGYTTSDSLEFEGTNLTYIEDTHRGRDHDEQTYKCSLTDLDPDRSTGNELDTTDKKGKIVVESNSHGPDLTKETKTYNLSSMNVWSGNVDMDRWAKAWKHLIRLSGGKPSKKEPF